MAVPKMKVSKARRNTRCSNNSKITPPTLVECPSCHELKQPNVACPKSGFYKRKKVIKTEKKKNEEK